MKTAYIIIIIVGSFLFLTVFERVQTERTGHKVAELLEDISFKEAKNQYLRYEIGLHKSASTITESAQQKGMSVIAPQNIYIIEVKQSGSK